MPHRSYKTPPVCVHMHCSAEHGISYQYADTYPSVHEETIACICCADQQEHHSIRTNKACVDTGYKAASFSCRIITVLQTVCVVKVMLAVVQLPATVVCRSGDMQSSPVLQNTCAAKYVGSHASQIVSHKLKVSVAGQSIRSCITLHEL